MEVLFKAAGTSRQSAELNTLFLDGSTLLLETAGKMPDWSFPEMACLMLASLVSRTVKEDVRKDMNILK
jgi:hypothetical protein